MDNLSFLKPPSISIDFLESASDDFFRTALHSMRQLVFPEYSTGSIELSMQARDRVFIYLEPH
jgi:hypothetical protein